MIDRDQLLAALVPVRTEDIPFETRAQDEGRAAAAPLPAHLHIFRGAPQEVIDEVLARVKAG
jgi:hypothetical protein